MQCIGDKFAIPHIPVSSVIMRRLIDDYSLFKIELISTNYYITKFLLLIIG